MFSTLLKSSFRFMVHFYSASKWLKKDRERNRERESDSADSTR